MACGVTWYGMVLVGHINGFGMVGYGRVWYGVCMVWLWYGVLWGMVWLGGAGSGGYDMVWQGMPGYRMVPHGMVLAEHITCLEYGMVWHRMVWCGMVGCPGCVMVRYGMCWSGLVGCDVV